MWRRSAAQATAVRPADRGGVTAPGSSPEAWRPGAPRSGRSAPPTATAHNAPHSESAALLPTGTSRHRSTGRRGPSLAVQSPRRRNPETRTSDSGVRQSYDRRFGQRRLLTRARARVCELRRGAASGGGRATEADASRCLAVLWGAPGLVLAGLCRKTLSLLSKSDSHKYQGPRGPAGVFMCACECACACATACACALLRVCMCLFLCACACVCEVLGPPSL